MKLSPKIATFCPGCGHKNLELKSVPSLIIKAEKKEPRLFRDSRLRDEEQCNNANDTTVQSSFCNLGGTMQKKRMQCLTHCNVTIFILSVISNTT